MYSIYGYYIVLLLILRSKDKKKLNDIVESFSVAIIEGKEGHDRYYIFLCG